MRPTQFTAHKSTVAVEDAPASKATRSCSAEDVAYATAAVPCPVCGNNTARRSHRRSFIERLRSKLTGKVPFRCKSCNSREWIRIDRRDL